MRLDSSQWRAVTGREAMGTRYLNIDKPFFFTLWLLKHCNRLPKEVVESLSLEVFKNWMLWDDSEQGGWATFCNIVIL